MSVRARVEWVGRQPGFTGTVEIHQRDPRDPAVYHVRLDLGRERAGRLCGFHIHQNPTTHADDLKRTCASCGGHFNPLNQTHGSVLNHDPHRRHAGDLINNVLCDEHGKVDVVFRDDLAILIPTDNKPYSVFGKSLVVHEGTDDLGRRGAFTGRPPCISGTEQWQPHLGTFRAYEDPAKAAESLKTGNAGARIACGNIVRVMDCVESPRGYDILRAHYGTQAQPTDTFSTR